MFRKQENGRSMIEMLGVLAIIGVLSVGGIAGYTSAMRSHRTNEIINSANMLYTLGVLQNGGDGSGNLDFTTAIGDLPKGCSTITYNDKLINLTIDDQDDCYLVKTKLGDKAGDCTAATGGATGYTLTVTLGEEGGDTFTCNPTCENGQLCINGACEDKVVCDNSLWYVVNFNKCVSEMVCTEGGISNSTLSNRDEETKSCTLTCNEGFVPKYEQWADGWIYCVDINTTCQSSTYASSHPCECDSTYEIEHPCECDSTYQIEHPCECDSAYKIEHPCECDSAYASSHPCCDSTYEIEHPCECDNDYRTSHIYECGGTDAEKYASCLSSFEIYGEEATKSICPNYVQCMNLNELHCEALFWGPDCRPCILSGKDTMECTMEGKC